MQDKNLDFFDPMEQTILRICWSWRIIFVEKQQVRDGYLTKSLLGILEKKSTGVRKIVQEDSRPNIGSIPCTTQSPKHHQTIPQPLPKVALVTSFPTPFTPPWPWWLLSTAHHWVVTAITTRGLDKILGTWCSGCCPMMTRHGVSTVHIPVKGPCCWDLIGKDLLPITIYSNIIGAIKTVIAGAEEKAHRARTHIWHQRPNPGTAWPPEHDSIKLCGLQYYWGPRTTK